MRVSKYERHRIKQSVTGGIRHRYGCRSQIGDLTGQQQYRPDTSNKDHLKRSLPTIQQKSADQNG
jgi:hypothetical protein